MTFRRQKSLTVSEPDIPLQREGTQFDVSYAAVAPSQKEAHEVFKTVADRVLCVNDWKGMSGAFSSEFLLFNAEGEQVKRKAQVNDYVRIDIPGPGPTAGYGYDWVHIQSVQDQRNARSHSEFVSILVRPSSPPGQSAEDVAHFLNSTASSSFVVTREGNVVTAAVHSRNETPNANAVSLVDKVRNTLVSAGALSGFSRLQWQALMKGLFNGLDVKEHKLY